MRNFIQFYYFCLEKLSACGGFSSTLFILHPQICKTQGTAKNLGTQYTLDVMSYENKVSSLDLLTGGYFWSLGLNLMFCKIYVGKISFWFGILKMKI